MMQLPHGDSPIIIFYFFVNYVALKHFLNTFAISSVGLIRDFRILWPSRRTPDPRSESSFAASIRYLYFSGFL